MADVNDFNEQYFNCILGNYCGDKKCTSETLNVDMAQIDEIFLMSADAIKTVSRSQVAVAEPVFKLSDLTRRRAAVEPESASLVVATLNYSYLLMVRSLAAQDLRLAFYTTHTPEELSKAIKQMSLKELEFVANANRLMFKFSLSPKSIVKANSCSKSADSDIRFLKHIPLMTLNVNEGVRS